MGVNVVANAIIYPRCHSETTGKNARLARKRPYATRNTVRTAACTLQPGMSHLWTPVPLSCHPSRCSHPHPHTPRRWRAQIPRCHHTHVPAASPPTMYSTALPIRASSGRHPPQGGTILTCKLRCVLPHDSVSRSRITPGDHRVPSLGLRSERGRSFPLSHHHRYP